MNCTKQTKIIVKKTRKSTKLLFLSMNLLMNNLDSLSHLFKNVTATRKTWRRETNLMKLVFIQVVPFSTSPLFSSHKVCPVIMVWNQYKRYDHLTIFFFFCSVVAFLLQVYPEHFALPSFFLLHAQASPKHIISLCDVLWPDWWVYCMSNTPLYLGSEGGGAHIFLRRKKNGDRIT